MKKILIVIVLTLVLLTLFLISDVPEKPAYDPARTFSSETLKEDLGILWDILEEGHGGFDRYTSREALRKDFDAVAAGIDAPLTEFEFLLRIMPLVAAIKDGHTRIMPSTAASAFLDGRPAAFPFGLRFTGDRAYIFRNLSGDRSIPDGSELLAVNGTPVGDILADLAALSPSDAGIRTRKIRQMEFPANFARLYAVRYGRPESFRIRIRPRGGAPEREVAVPGVKAGDLSPILNERYPDTARRPPLYELAFRGDIGILTIRAFADMPRKDGPNFVEFLEAAFRTLDEKKTPGLVIDLRQNGGGQDDYAKLVFAHVMDRPFLYYKALEARKDHYDLFKYTNVPKAQIDKFPQEVRRNARGWYDVLGHPNTGIQEPAAPRFAGPVALLIGGSSFSAAGETTSLFHFHKKAAFFGEECGAGYYGNTSGFMVLAALPATGIQVRVPLILYTMAVDGYPPDRGLVPDFPAAPTIEDILAGRDPVMDRALEWLAARPTDLRDAGASRRPEAPPAPKGS